MMKKLPKIMSIVLFFFAACPAFAASVGDSKIVLNHTYICHFGRYGVVTIDTRSPGASITIGGVRHPAQAGSYFYQADDGKIAIAFNPAMTAWTLLSTEEPAGITDSNCKVIVNTPHQ